MYAILATASEDASIRLWDCESGDHENTMKGHTGKINYISFHPQG